MFDQDSAENQLESLYKDIWKEVSPQVQGQRRGVLSYVIYFILEDEKLQADRICNFFNIKASAYMEDDIQIAASIISEPKEESIFLKPWKIINHQEAEKDEHMKYWIVAIGCTVVGAYACIRYLEKSQEKKTKQRVRANVVTPQPTPTYPVTIAPPPQPFPVALRLVVPAFIGNDVMGKNLINTSDIEKLIDNASYFLCTKIVDLDSIEQRLEFTDENISTIGERREVYIRIHIDNGQDMLDKKVPYILKRNLPSHGQGVVKQLACLRDLSGLEQFNRV